MGVEKAGEKYRCNICGNEVVVTKVLETILAVFLVFASKNVCPEILRLFHGHAAALA
ncbi:MAG: hypothetical protein O8C62_03665 [Candidatus Methanoperedens sp.]|nr:hypothetical protein [Candidatus Methanoperedens sp.]